MNRPSNPSNMKLMPQKTTAGDFRPQEVLIPRLHPHIPQTPRHAAAACETMGECGNSCKELLSHLPGERGSAGTWQVPRSIAPHFHPSKYNHMPGKSSSTNLHSVQLGLFAGQDFAII